MVQVNLEGEYFFRKTEMVAGFNFSADGTFQFFFSYGAVDRSAAGSFTTEGNLVKLKSNKEAGKDFTVAEQSKAGSGYTIQFSHPNTFLTENIRCLFFMGDTPTEAYTDRNGKVQVDLENCDRIYAQHLLYPDIVTQIKDSANNNNHFTCSLNPSLEQLSFKGINLTIEEDGSLS
ncbi:MAG: hypothetical protein ACKOU7_05195, partial [Ferruginibacter sp.]